MSLLGSMWSGHWEISPLWGLLGSLAHLVFWKFWHKDCFKTWTVKGFLRLAVWVLWQYDPQRQYITDIFASSWVHDSVTAPRACFETSSQSALFLCSLAPCYTQLNRGPIEVIWSSRLATHSLTLIFAVDWSFLGRLAGLCTLKALLIPSLPVLDLETVGFFIPERPQFSALSIALFLAELISSYNILSNPVNSNQHVSLMIFFQSLPWSCHFSKPMVCLPGNCKQQFDPMLCCFIIQWIDIFPS